MTNQPLLKEKVGRFPCPLPLTTYQLLTLERGDPNHDLHAFNEVILVVGYLGGMIQKRFGGEYKGKRILYLEQENPVGGSAQALWLAKDILKDKFVINDLYKSSYRFSNFLSSL
jgi:hypothetical protein